MTYCVVRVFSEFHSLMAGKRGCPCCSTTEEPKAVPLSTPNAATPLAPADQLWSTSRDKAVRLRMEGSGPASHTPITIHQMFLETVENHGDHTALAFKEEGQWVTMTYRQYYQHCRAAAKSFLKVCLCANGRVQKIYSYSSANRKYLGSDTFVLVCQLSIAAHWILYKTLPVRFKCFSLRNCTM